MSRGWYQGNNFYPLMSHFHAVLTMLNKFGAFGGIRSLSTYILG